MGSSPSTCLRMSRVHRVRQCSGDGGGHTDDRSWTAGSHEERDYLHHPPLWSGDGDRVQSVACHHHWSPHSSHCPIIPTIPIIPVLISHGPYQSIISPAWCQCQVTVKQQLHTPQLSPPPPCLCLPAPGSGSWPRVDCVPLY